MRLRIPAALVFTLTASCGEEGSPPPTDATAKLDGQVVCQQYCIDQQGGACNGEPTCVDANGECPAGCLPEPVI
jgi:hypothetical protein